ncbi:hypothetical protein K1X76_12240 [bacterium]|nr:hypothetical protein [bacterium]
MNWKEKFKDVLSPLLTLYTITYIGLMLVDFILKEKFDMPGGMMPVYIALVGAYSAEKEIKRWVGKEDPPKRGSIYVYFWLVFFLIAFVMSSIDKAFVLPKDLTAVALQVLGIFFGSKASKKIYEETTGKNPSNEEKYTTREDQVLALIDDNGKVTRKEVVTVLKVSNSTAGRILAEMEKAGRISQVGDFKDAYYIKNTGSKPEE